MNKKKHINTILLFPRQNQKNITVPAIICFERWKVKPVEHKQQSVIPIKIQ